MTTFFTQFYEGVQNFPETGMELTIEDLEQVDNPAGQDVNINEVWSYRVRVRINGWLDTTGVVVRVAGQNGTRVGKSPDGPWRRQVLSDPMDIASGHSQRTEELYFRAPSTAGPQTLFDAHVADWNADFSSLQNIYSIGRDDLAVTFATDVVGN